LLGMMAPTKAKGTRPVGRLGARIREYVAREAARHYGCIEPSLVRRTRRNLRDNFGVLLAPDYVSSLLAHYKDVYETAAALLPAHLAPVERGTYADPSHVRWDGFVLAIAQRHRRERRELLGLIANFAIYYEYLR
jgi:hypothetical protein